VLVGTASIHATAQVRASRVAKSGIYPGGIEPVFGVLKAGTAISLAAQKQPIHGQDPKLKDRKIFPSDLAFFRAWIPAHEVGWQAIPGLAQRLTRSPLAEVPFPGTQTGFFPDFSRDGVACMDFGPALKADLYPPDRIIKQQAAAGIHFHLLAFMGAAVGMGKEWKSRFFNLPQHQGSEVNSFFPAAGSQGKRVQGVFSPGTTLNQHGPAILFNLFQFRFRYGSSVCRLEGFRGRGAKCGHTGVEFVLNPGLSSLFYFFSGKEKKSPEGFMEGNFISVQILMQGPKECRW
jgi:hypothetical protein